VGKLGKHSRNDAIWLLPEHRFAYNWAITPKLVAGSLEGSSTGFYSTSISVVITCKHVSNEDFRGSFRNFLAIFFFFFYFYLPIFGTLYVPRQTLILSLSPGNLVKTLPAYDCTRYFTWPWNSASFCWKNVGSVSKQNALRLGLTARNRKLQKGT
jgi:hypothetical protein